MDIQKVNNAAHPFFDEFWQVYNDSFPQEEKRNVLQQTEIFSKPEYSLDIYLEEGALKGFLAYWSFPNFIFIEHLAITKSGQGKGLGNIILSDFINEHDLPIILEIEHPKDETCVRRLRFYERVGFKNNTYRHYQPAFIKGNAPLSLTILSYPNPISEKLYSDFCKLQQEVVMNHEN